MNKYNVEKKVYVKSGNSSPRIMARYTYTLIVFTILSILINLFIHSDIIQVLKNLGVSIIATLVFTYIINLFKKDYDIKKIFINDNALAIGIILGLFPNQSIIILLAAIIVTLAIKNIFKNINLSATAYGLLVIITYNTYFLDSYHILSPIMYLSDSNTLNEILGKDILNYLFTLNYLSPALVIIIFFYLFHKKGIKYQIVIYYILTIFLIFMGYSLFKGHIWILFTSLFANPLFFLTTYLLTDYQNTPTIGEAGMVYGIILGIITAILKFIVPELAVIITIILGSLCLTKYLDKISYKLKYSKKKYNFTIIVCVVLVIITITSLIIIY